MSETPGWTSSGEHAPASAPQELLLGRYRVLERRGTGGFGTVCTCWDTRLMRRVAIKRMPLAAETGTTAQEALAEARTACMLGHPNIVTVFDFEADGAYAYLVMEYVDGLNLAELLARVEGGRLTPEECAHVLSSVARALDFAHENRVLHLDIKPTNIMVDRQGTVKLADFGMATLASAAGYGGARGGTVGYMPPEQIEGGLVDERTDVFSLAVVVWQSLTGRNPFLARTPEESLRKIGHGPGRPARSMPAGVEEALLAELSPAPAGRDASVLAFADELAGCLGSAREGAESLRELVGQAEEDEGASRRGPGRTLRLPRWLASPGRIAPRALTALATFVALRLVTPAISALAPEAAAVASLVAALASAALPQLGAPVVVAALVVALLGADPSGLAALGACALGVASCVWWATCGLRERMSSLALLLPCCLPSPAAGAALSGYALDPGPAAATTALGYVLGTTLHLSVSMGFSPDATAQALLSAAAEPGTWIVLAGAVGCAAASSAVALRGSVAAGVIGQALGLAILVGSEVFAARMENPGISPAIDWGSVVLAVLLSVLMCVATALRGPLYEDQEGEGSYDELSE